MLVPGAGAREAHAAAPAPGRRAGDPCAGVAGRRLPAGRRARARGAPPPGRRPALRDQARPLGRPGARAPARALLGHRAGRGRRPPRRRRRAPALAGRRRPRRRDRAPAGLGGGAARAAARRGDPHDVGKVAIPDELLRKEGPLTDEELAVVRSHAALGAELSRGSRASSRSSLGPPRARARRRDRLPARPGRRGDPARVARHRGGRRLGRDDLRPAPPPGRSRREARWPSCAPAAGPTSTCAAPSSCSRSSAAPSGAGTPGAAAAA